jgi:hypothetical protein
MRNIRNYRRLLIAPTRVLLAAALLLPLAIAHTATATIPVDTKADEVIAKHLESLGDAAARASARRRVAVGTSRAIFRGSGGNLQADGGVVLASDNSKSLLGMKFDIAEYTGEKFGFDGKKFTVGYVTPGKRTTLGSFLLSNGNIFKEGLVGGTLSSAWPLLDLAVRGAKLKLEGTEKIGDISAYKLSYTPRNGSDLSIALYFDTKTYQHVRTQYERMQSAPIGSGGGIASTTTAEAKKIDAQAGNRGARFKLIEDFSDYKLEGKLNLPHAYTIQLEIQAATSSVKNKWEMTLQQFAFNQEIDDKEFNVEGK